MYDDYDSRDEYDDRARQRRPPPPPRDRRQDSRGPPGPPPERKSTRVSYKSIAGMIVAVVALIFVIILMYSGYSWYLISYEEQPEGVSAEKETRSFDFKQDEFTAELEVRLGNLTPDSLSIKETFQYNETSKDIKEVMDWVGNFYVISMILLIVSIIMMPIGALGKMPHGLPLIPILIALILTLIIPIYFFVYFPPGLETQLEGAYDSTDDTGFKYDGDFFGSKSGDFYDNETDLQKEFEMEFGPKIAFWLSFVPMFIILAALSVYSAGKKDLQYGGPPRRPPPGRGPGYDRDREYDDRDYDERPPPRRRPPDDYDHGGPPRGPPPRPPRGRPPRRGHDAYNGGGQDEHYNPPVLDRDYDFDSARGRSPPRRRG